MIGQTISHYKILEQLGEGGMGVVYKALDTRLDRHVAIKFLPPHLKSDQAAKNRFIREAKAASALNHANIAVIHEVDETPEGQMFIVMAYYDGQTLKERLERGPLPIGEAVRMVTQVAAGLAAAHERGILHRDIKPANILTTKRGEAKLTDFGIAKLAGQTQKITKTGTTLGTVAYMSPEQVSGRDVDHRSDIFSLGVVLYELVAGELPFHGDHEAAVLYNIMHSDPKSLTTGEQDVPIELERVVRKAMAKNSAERYQDIDEMIADLGAASPGPGIEPSASAGESKRPRPGTSRRSRWPLSRPANIAIAVGVSLILLVVLGKYYVFRPSSRVVDSIAVLPLDNLSQDPEQEFFADGMTDVLIASMAKIGGLRVISRTSVMQYKDTETPLPDIARDLDVDAVIEGSILRWGDRVRITAQLIHAATDEHMWAETYERDMRDVLALQNDVALAIAKEIVLTLTPDEKTRLAVVPSVDPAAFEAYMRGRFHWNKRTPGDILEGLKYFEQAVAIDPNYAMAYVGVAESYNSCITLQIMSPREAVPRAKQAAQRALQLDDTLGEALCVIAALTDKECKFRQVIDDYDHATRMSPNYATARQWYAEALSRLGRHEEAIEQIRRAKELDPLSLPINTAVGEIHYNNLQYEAALAATSKALDLDPNFPAAVGLTAKIHDMNGAHDKAMAYYKKYMTLGGIDREIIDIFGQTYEQGGMDEARRWYVDNFRQAALGQLALGYSLALAHAMLGEKEQAIGWLEKLSDEHCWNVADIGVEPMFDGLRHDERYIRLLRKVGLER